MDSLLSINNNLNANEKNNRSINSDNNNNFSMYSKQYK